MAQEIELKLELTPEAADTLLGFDLLSGEPAKVGLQSIYFDTSAQDLRRGGFSLRIRRAGDRRIQTIKAASGPPAGLFVRPEWEQPVDGDVPVLEETTPVKALLGDVVDRVRPAFEVHVERRSWLVETNEATLELVLDRGEVVAADRHAPICEIEMELKAGPPEALYALARHIGEVVPMRIGVVSKAERGYRLIGPLQRSVKSEPVAVTPDMSAVAAFRLIAGACTRHFRLNEALVDRFNAEALHQARVALRRLRSAFAIHRPIIGDAGSSRLNEELRWLANELGAARDLDVLVARAGADGMRAALERARNAAYDEAEAALDSPRARALMLDLSEWLATGPLSESGDARDFAGAALDRFRSKVRKGGRDLARLGDEARHEVRKDAKKLRYAAEFFAPLFTEKRQRRRYARLIAELEQLQDRLGTLNDMASVAAVLSRAGLDSEPGAERLAAAGNKALLVEAAAEAQDAFADTKPFWR
ncbi:MAG: CHAD domain-containing protein [Rhizobiaceae bacterium]|nr:CHAD domain-containing protein [Rhizobiaceae bacterium]